MNKKQLLRLSFIIDEIIDDNYLHIYNRNIINNIINKSDYKLDRSELEYILFKIYKRLNNKKSINHEQTRLKV